MRNKLTILLCTIIFGLFLFTCKKEKIEYIAETPTEEILETPTDTLSTLDGASQFVISHNYIMRIMNFALTNALIALVIK